MADNRCLKVDLSLLVVYCMEWRIATGDFVGVKEGDDILIDIRKILLLPECNQDGGISCHLDDIEMYL